MTVIIIAINYWSSHRFRLGISQQYIKIKFQYHLINIDTDINLSKSLKLEASGNISDLFNLLFKLDLETEEYNF